MRCLMESNLPDNWIYPLIWPKLIEKYMEYELNKTYADDKVAFSEYLKELREEIRKDTLEKLGE